MGWWGSGVMPSAHANAEALGRRINKSLQAGGSTVGYLVQRTRPHLSCWEGSPLRAGAAAVLPLSLLLPVKKRNPPLPLERRIPPPPLLPPAGGRFRPPALAGRASGAAAFLPSAPGSWLYEGGETRLVSTAH